MLRIDSGSWLTSPRPAVRATAGRDEREDLRLAARIFDAVARGNAHDRHGATARQISIAYDEEKPQNGGLRNCGVEEVLGGREPRVREGRTKGRLMHGPRLCSNESDLPSGDWGSTANDNGWLPRLSR